MLYIASDHGGFKTKQKIIEFLSDINVEYVDLGPTELNPTDDYPDFAIAAMKRFEENTGENKAVLLCRSGVGVNIIANKYKGARCTLSWDEKHTESARVDDDVNVLAIPSDYVDAETAKNLVSIFLRTKFSNEDRHTRRLEKIREIEL